MASVVCRVLYQQIQHIKTADPKMCRKVTCSKCGKPTWAGCGQHIAQVCASRQFKIILWCAANVLLVWTVSTWYSMQVYMYPVQCTARRADPAHRKKGRRYQAFCPGHAATDALYVNVQALADVPPDQRCKCKEKEAK